MKKLFLYAFTILIVSSLTLTIGCKKAEEQKLEELKHAEAPPAPATAPLAPASEKPAEAPAPAKPSAEVAEPAYTPIYNPKPKPAPAPTGEMTSSWKPVDAPAPPSTPISAPQLFWNVWPEDNNDARFQPVTSLKPGKTCRIAIDLAALEYRPPGGISIVTSKSFNKEVDKWLKPAMPPPTLNILLLTDKRKLEIAASEAMQDFPIDIQQLRKVWQSGRIKVDGDHFKILHDEYVTDPQKYPKFKFGGIFFKLKTKKVEGPASIAFSIWHENKPIDEVSFQVCIASSPEVEKEKCGDMKQSASSQGLFSVRVASESRESPIAAIHFLSLGENEPVVGILHAETWAKDQFLIWQLTKKVADFRREISDEYIPNIMNGDSDENLLVRGLTFFNYLFPVEAMSDGGEKVQEEFLNLLRPHLKKDPFAKDYYPRSIFVRMLQVSPSPSLPIPLGLVAVKIGEGNKITKDNGKFLGKFFIIESPLEFQTYESSTECLSRWLMALPPEDTGDDAINDARNQLGSRIKKWKEEKALVREPFYSMTEFMEWLNSFSSVQAEDPPTVLVTLSHHDHNSLYYYKKDSAKDNPLLPSMINRPFAQPSIAILNGCGTGGEGAVHLISRLNEKGFSTIIATSTQVEGLMAGAFLNLLSEEIARNDRGKPDTIGLLYWKTINALSTLKPIGVINAREFGAKALKYTLLGNGRVAVCSPKEEKRPLTKQ